MATEEEAREAVADGEEVQVEAVDLGTPHLQMNLDSKLSAHGMKDEAKIMDSTEGMLKVTEDQVLEKTPSVVEIPPEHTPNGTASSLNGHMKEGEILNEKPQENGQKANEQAEASPDGIRTDQNNRSNGEDAVDSLGHVESSTEDTSLLTDENEEPKEHYQQDVESSTVEEETVHEDRVETDEPTVDAQQGQNLEPAEVTEDTQHTSTSCIPHDEVVAEAPAGVQTSLEPNVDDSGALPDASDGNTETETAKVDKESCTEGEDTAEHANEIIKLEDQPSKQTDDVDAELVKEDVPTSKKTDVPEAMTKAEQADESMSPSDQEELNQESAEETIDPVCERTEETSHGSYVSASEKTTPEHDATAREPALDVQEVQSQGLAEEIADAKEVDSEKTVQQSGVAFEEATQEHNVATTEPSSDIQHLDNVESEEIKGLEDAKAEDASNESNVIIPEDAAQDKEATEDIQPVQGLEEEPKSTGTVEVEEASNQPHADVLNNHAEEDGVPACLHQVKDTGVTETQEITQQSHAAASEQLVTEDKSMAVDSRNDDIQQTLEQGSVKVKDTEASETQEICHERTISASEEDSAEDDVTAEGPTSDAQEVEILESVEEIKDNTADNIVEASNVATVEEADQEHNVLTSDDVSEQQTREVEPEEIQSTEHVETEEASDERHPALLKDPTQEDSIPSDMLNTESTEEAKETEATKTEVLPQESNISTSEEPASEENITAGEITCDAQEVENSEQAENVEDNKDTGTKDISGHSNENNLEEMATEDNITIQTDASIQQLQEQEPVELRDTEATELQGISPSHIVSTSRESTPEDNVTAELSPDSQAENLESATVTEETKDVRSTDAVAEEETPEEHVQEFEAPVHTPSAEEPELEETKNTDNQMDAAVLENTTHEDNPTASELLVMESTEVSISEATEGQEMPQSEVTQSEDHETEENTTASEPKVLETEDAEEMRDTEPTEPQSISQESIVSISEESVPEDVTAKEPASDTKEVQTEEPELIDEHNDVKAGEISNQSSVSIVGETAQANLESATVSEETKEVKSTDAIAEEETPAEHVQEFVAPVDIPAVEEPELEETKNTEPVSVHDNVMTNDLPAEEVKDTQATEITEIHNESGHLTEDVKSNVVLSDEASPDEDAEATEATADIPRAQDSEQEQIKNNEPVELEDNIIARDLPEEEIKATEAMETEVIPDESTSAKITELTNDALAEEAAPEELVIETEATIDIPRAKEPELEEIKNAEPAELEENISATDRSAEEIEATDTTEAEAINESINANTSELTEDVTAKEAASDIKEVQTEEPELIDEHNDVKDGEISNQSSRTIVGVTAQENLESAAVTEETEDVKSTDAIAEEETPVEHVQEFEAPVDTAPVEEPELEEAKNTEHVSVHDNVMTNDLPAEEVKDTQATEIAEIHNESGNLTEDVNSNVVLLDEAAPGEDVEATEATADIPQAQDPEQEQIKNNESVEVEDDIIARDLPEEEIKDTEAMETEVIPDESTSAKVTELTNDVKSNVARAEETAPEEHGIETEATIDIPRAQEPELEETKNTEPLEVDENISATDQSAEETDATEAMETEAINESIHANSRDLAEGVKRNFALEDEATHEEHVIEAETTVNIPRAQEPELEEIKNTEPVEVKEDKPASDLPAEEMKETEVISESTDANISEPTEDAKRNVALADKAASEDHVIAPEATVDVPQAQEPELDLPAEENLTENEPQTTGIEPTRPEPTPHESNVTIQQLQEKEPDEFCDTEATEPQGISPSHIASTSEEFTPEDNVAKEPSPDTQAEDIESAVVTEETKDVKSTDAIAEEIQEEHVQESEAPVDIPPVEEPELEETKNTEPVEVHDHVATNDLPAEEVKNTEATEIAEIHNESGDLTEDVKSTVALADDAAPGEDAKATEETADIPRAQEPELEEIKNSEPVEVKENILGSDLPAEEVKETEVISESTDANITEDANRNVAVADEAAPEGHVIATEETVDIPRAQEPERGEIENAEHVEVEENISANDLPAEEVKDTVIMETQAIKESTDANITELTEDVALADEAVPEIHVDILSAQEPAVEEINNTKPVEVEDSIASDDVPAEEINDTEAMETEEIPRENTDDSLTASAPLADIQQAPEESCEQGSNPDLLVQSEHSKDQLVKAEKTGQSNGATLEEPTAEDNTPNETDPLADAKEEHRLESVEGNKGIKADEGEETSHPSQDAEEPVSENIVAKVEPTSDIQQVNDLDEAKEMTVTEAIDDDDETSCKKTEVATLEGLSPTDNGTSPKQKDESSELGENTAFTTQKGESPTEEDVVQISSEDTVGISNNIEQIKEQSKSVTEADTIKSGEHTSDQGDEQLHNVELQMQVCERSVDVSAIEQPDKDAKKVNLDQQQKEDEVTEEQMEEIQGNEQKHDDNSADLTTETLLEPQSNEIGTTDLNQDTDEFEAEQTETVATEMLMNEQTLHVPQGSIPITADVKVENYTEIEETPEQEKAPNNIGTLYTDADAGNYNEDEKENIEIDAAVAKPSTDKQDGTADETINEEVGNGLASPVEKDLQKTSDPAPSNEETLENDTTVVPENVEPRVHREERESINKANDDMEASQASEEEIVDEVEKKQERKNEDTDVNNDEVQTKPVGEEASEMHSNDSMDTKMDDTMSPYAEMVHGRIDAQPTEIEEVEGNNDEVQTKPVGEEASEMHSNDSTDTKMDDTMSPYAEMVHGRIDAQPTEIEEVEGNKGFSSISEYVVEYPKQNDIEQDLVIHQKVVDDKLATAEPKGAEVETNSDEEMATSYTAVTEAVKFDEAIDDKASGADGALSDENVKTFEENRRNLEASSGESMNEDKEHHNLALPAYSAVNGNTTEQASVSEVTERGLLFPEKPLPTESEEQEESQTTKEQDEDIHGQETGDTEKEDKEDEQSDLPVSNFLMNLIMGKESTETDRALEFEDEKKQEEITKDDSCLITSQHEESLVPVPTESKVDDKLIFEQGKHNLEGSKEIHDFKLDSDEVLSRNTHNLEAPVHENNVQGEISTELVPGGHCLMTEVETGDIKLGEKTTNSEERSLKNDLDDSTNPNVSQEDALEEGRTDLQHESLPEDISSDAVAEQTLLSTEPDTSDEKKLPKDNGDLQSLLSTKREEFTESSITEAENAIEAELENEVEQEEGKQHTTNTGGATEGKIENLHGNSQRGTEAIPDEQTAEITEPVMGTEINLVHEKEIFTGSECEEETQSSEKALDIQPDGSSLHVNQDKQDESAGDQIVMEKNNLLDKPGESNLHEEQEAEIGQESPKESDGGQNCLATTEPVIKEENANRTVEAHVQTVNTKSIEEQEIFMSQVQERGLDVVSAKEAPEAEENIVEMAKPKFSTDEEQSSKEDKSVMAGEKTCVEKTKDEEEAKSFADEVATKIEEQGAVQKATHNQTRDLNVVLPTEAPGSEESFVDIKTPEFSTDEEQSPKEDESSMAEDNSYDEKTKGDQEAKNFTDEAPMKIEERGTGQKASPKKHNILSGVGSKVKHQLAKVKKAIIGKPGHAKSELAKS